jgi:hypothetical protein
VDKGRADQFSKERMTNHHRRVFGLSLVIIGLGLITAATFLFPGRTAAPTVPASPAPSSTPSTSVLMGAVDPLNATYIVEGQPVIMVNGEASTTIPGIKDPGATTQIVTRIFGQPTMGDLNNDSQSDAAFFLTQETGGTGLFFYVAAALSTANGAQGTNAIFLGDRIAPQTIQIENGQIVVNYADRKPSDSFSVSPSVGVTKYFAVINGVLREASSTPIPSVPVVGSGAHCGGNMMNAPVCTSGYHCAPAPGVHLPFGDVGGTCVAN